MNSVSVPAARYEVRFFWPEWKRPCYVKMSLWLCDRLFIFAVNAKCYHVQYRSSSVKFYQIISCMHFHLLNIYQIVICSSVDYTVPQNNELNILSIKLWDTVQAFVRTDILRQLEVCSEVCFGILEVQKKKTRTRWAVINRSANALTAFCSKYLVSVRP